MEEDKEWISDKKMEDRFQNKYKFYFLDTELTFQQSKHSLGTRLVF